MILVPLSKSAADWVLRQVPLDDESRKVLESACEGLPGRFQEGGFVVQGEVPCTRNIQKYQK